MSKPEFVSTEVSDHIATVTLRRPDRLNALNDQLVLELTAEFDEIAGMGDVRVVILTGEGRAFCAGFDVGIAIDAAPPTPKYWQYHFEIGCGMMRRIWTLPQPVVAKVRGPCLGGGFNLSLSCDLVYASEDAFFGEPEVKFGGGSMFALHPWVMGLRHVNEILLTGRSFDAKRAYEIGIINEVIPAAELDQRVEKIARHMTLMPGATLAKNKKLIHRISELTGAMDAVRVSQDVSVLNISTRAENPSEFEQRKRKDGIKAALKWQKDRFDAIGAYQR